MRNSLLRKPLSILVILVTIISISTPVAFAADNMRSVTVTDIAGVGKVTITNNFNSRSSIELKLDARVVVNTAYKVYSSETVRDKTTLIGTVTVRKNTDTGRLAVAVGKLFSYVAGSVYLVKDGTTDPLKADYAAVGETVIATGGSAVKTRNVVSGPELLIVSQSILIQDMTVFAIVNGKIYKGTVRDTTRDFQLPLARDLEPGTRIYYSLAAPGCREMQYSMLLLGDVAMSAIVDNSSIRVFYQGEGVRTSSINVIGLNEGDTVRYYAAASGGSAIKTATVARNSFIANLTGLTLSPGTIYLTVARKGDKESTRIPVTVTATTASAPLGASNVTPMNVIGSGSVITVKGIAETDVVTFYDIRGNAVNYDDTIDTVYNSVFYRRFEGMDLGDAATRIFVSVKSMGSGESVWTQVSVKAALGRSATGDATLVKYKENEVTLVIEDIPSGSSVQLFRDEFALDSMGNTYKFAIPRSDDDVVGFEKDLQIAALRKALNITVDEDIVFYYTVTEAGKHPSESVKVELITSIDP